MKKKNMIITLFSVLFVLSFYVPSSWAGGSQQYGWAGFTIGFGGTIPGGAVFANYAYGYPAPGVVCRRPYSPRYVYYPPPRVIYRRPCPPPNVIYRRLRPPRYVYYPPPRHYRPWKYRKHYRPYCKKRRKHGFHYPHGR